MAKSITTKTRKVFANNNKKGIRREKKSPNQNEMKEAKQQLIINKINWKRKSHYWITGWERKILTNKLAKKERFFWPLPDEKMMMKNCSSVLIEFFLQEGN